MANPGIPGFDAAEVRAGLRLAMQVGLPISSADRPTFYMPQFANTTGSSGWTSTDGTPLDPDATVTRTTRVTHQVPCAIEYTDGAGKVLGGFGVIAQGKVVLTLLDQDYTTVVGFEFVVISGQRFFYDRTEPQIGLVDVGVWRVHCRSEDEG